MTNQVAFASKGSFDDYLIVPTYQSGIKSRNECKTSITLGNGMQLSMPLISASMAYLDTDSKTHETQMAFAQKMSEYGLVHILSRGYARTTLESRLKVYDELLRQFYRVGLAVGLNDLKANNKVKLQTVLNKNKTVPTIISIDIAHGAVVEAKDYSWLLSHDNVVIVVGNFAHPDFFRSEHLVNHNSVYTKLGIGGGSNCSTRLVTGVGYPQASLLMDSYHEGNPFKHRMISDGGIKHTGDFCKAIVMGATLVMAGGIFSQTQEAIPPKVVKKTLYSEVYTYGQASEYVKGNSKHVEGGLSVRKFDEIIPLSELLTNYKQALQSAMSYTGSIDLLTFREVSDIIQITNNTLKENGLR